MTGRVEWPSWIKVYSRRLLFGLELTETAVVTPIQLANALSARLLYHLSLSFTTTCVGARVVCGGRLGSCLAHHEIVEEHW